MKRNLIFAAAVMTSFVGVSCEKHRWEDKVEVVEEKVYDENDNLVEVIKTEVVVEKGAKRFFMDGHDDHKGHDEGAKKHHGDKPHTDGNSEDKGHGHSH